MSAVSFNDSAAVPIKNIFVVGLAHSGSSSLINSILTSVQPSSTASINKTLKTSTVSGQRATVSFNKISLEKYGHKVNLYGKEFDDTFISLYLESWGVACGGVGGDGPVVLDYSGPELDLLLEGYLPDKTPMPKSSGAVGSLIAQVRRADRNTRLVGMHAVVLVIDYASTTKPDGFSCFMDLMERFVVRRRMSLVVVTKLDEKVVVDDGVAKVPQVGSAHEPDSSVHDAIVQELFEKIQKVHSQFSREQLFVLSNYVVESKRNKRADKLFTEVLERSVKQANVYLETRAETKCAKSSTQKSISTASLSASLTALSTPATTAQTTAALTAKSNAFLDPSISIHSHPPVPTDDLPPSREHELAALRETTKIQFDEQSRLVDELKSKTLLLESVESKLKELQGHLIAQETTVQAKDSRIIACDLKSQELNDLLLLRTGERDASALRLSTLEQSLLEATQQQLSDKMATSALVSNNEAANSTQLPSPPISPLEEVGASKGAGANSSSKLEDLQAKFDALQLNFQNQSQDLLGATKEIELLSAQITSNLVVLSERDVDVMRVVADLNDLRIQHDRKCLELDVINKEIRVPISSAKGVEGSIHPKQQFETESQTEEQLVLEHSVAAEDPNERALNSALSKDSEPIEMVNAGFDSLQQLLDELQNDYDALVETSQQHQQLLNATILRLQESIDLQSHGYDEKYAQVHGENEILAEILTRLESKHDELGIMYRTKLESVDLLHAQLENSVEQSNLSNDALSHANCRVEEGMQELDDLNREMEATTASLRHATLRITDMEKQLEESLCERSELSFEIVNVHHLLHASLSLAEELKQTSETFHSISTQLESSISQQLQSSQTIESQQKQIRELQDQQMTAQLQLSATNQSLEAAKMRSDELTSSLLDSNTQLNQRALEYEECIHQLTQTSSDLDRITRELEAKETFLMEMQHQSIEKQLRIDELQLSLAAASNSNLISSIATPPPSTVNVAAHSDTAENDSPVSPSAHSLSNRESSGYAESLDAGDVVKVDIEQQSELVTTLRQQLLSSGGEQQRLQEALTELRSTTTLLTDERDRLQRELQARESQASAVALPAIPESSAQNQNPLVHSSQNVMLEQELERLRINVKSGELELQVLQNSLLEAKSISELQAQNQKLREQLSTQTSHATDHAASPPASALCKTCSVM